VCRQFEEIGAGDEKVSPPSPDRVKELSERPTQIFYAAEKMGDKTQKGGFHRKKIISNWNKLLKGTG